ncbi:PIN/TRAM domain-containing protein [Clostridium acetireducens]|uniref:PIN/TRAM domain-containing protein n=1 Tax=Clostridium acetireducens TaxID=76489 RepID=UPI000C717755|nr:PIN/TRAM domain-containing protein [Clostridium acetireducens]
MFNKILRGLFTITGIGFGYLIGREIVKTEYFLKIVNFKSNTIMSIFVIIFCSLVFGIILFLLSSWINKGIIKIMEYVEKKVQKLPINDVILGTLGAIIGLLISSLFVNILSKIPVIGPIIAVVIAIIVAALGVKIAIKKKDDITNLMSNAWKKGASSKEKKMKNQKGTPKVLDTSVIIDGRIFDICKTGFIEGSLVIPNFVLEELRHIADSSDSLKRNRGRRGLDILNKIQKELDIEVQIYEKDFPDIAEVDSKLLKLAQVLGGKVITNDYNLNKVAEFQGVDVLNINELSNAVKPIALPGEQMKVQVIKDGKELGQGLAYLDDGTMIVVENGKKYIGNTIEVIVTSVLQTAAGRMIFAKPKGEF